jgi:hypothetical protein
MDISENAHIIIEFRPSLKRLFCDCWYWARGLQGAYDAYYYNGWPNCYICGRKRDFIFNLVPLMPYLDMSLDNKLVYICKDHGRVTDYDCTTGEKTQLPLPVPYWQRGIRNSFYWLILTVVTLARFAWFFVYHSFMWYVWIYLYLWLRKCRSTL